jgi:hypothetical protein
MPYSTNVQDFSADQVTVIIEGIGGTVSASGITNIDTQFAEKRLINAGSLLVSGGKLGDRVSLHVVDAAGVMAPAGTVLNVFAKNMYVNHEQVFQIHYDIPYVAALHTFMALRIVYDATDADTRHIYLNLIGHIPKDGT